MEFAHLQYHSYYSVLIWSHDNVTSAQHVNMFSCWGVLIILPSGFEFEFLITTQIKLSQSGSECGRLFHHFFPSTLKQCSDMTPELWRIGSVLSPQFSFHTCTTQQEILCSNPLLNSGEGWWARQWQDKTYLFHCRDHVTLFTSIQFNFICIVRNHDIHYIMFIVWM